MALKARFHGMESSAPGGEGGVGVGDRGVGDAGPAEAGDVAGDEADERPAVVGGQQAQVVPGDRLVARRGHLQRRGQVDPELDGVGRAPAPVHPLGRQLVVEDATAGGHPLGVALADHAAAAIGVVVGDLAVEDVAHGLEAAVRMPGRALGLFGSVDLRAEVVQQQERVGRRPSTVRPGRAGGH